MKGSSSSLSLIIRVLDTPVVARVLDGRCLRAVVFSAHGRRLVVLAFLQVLAEVVVVTHVLLLLLIALMVASAGCLLRLHVQLLLMLLLYIADYLILLLLLQRESLGV